MGVGPGRVEEIIGLLTNLPGSGMKPGLPGRMPQREILMPQTANFCSILKEEPLPRVMRVQRGFTLMELAIAISIVAILFTALLTRVWFYQREVERIATEQVVRALQLQLVSMTVRGRMNDLSGLGEQNPMDWLERKPPNYLGAFYGPNQDELELGNWFFDKKEKKLVYLYSRSENSDVTTPKRLNFKVKLINNRDSAVRQVGSGEIFNSAILEQVVE
jgi:prepilin-type N-terminal cleavage/methylation domain-containing protein